MHRYIRYIDSPWTLTLLAGSLWAVAAFADPDGHIENYYYYKKDLARYHLYRYSLMLIKVACIWNTIALVRSAAA